MLRSINNEKRYRSDKKIYIYMKNTDYIKCKQNM